MRSSHIQFYFIENKVHSLKEYSLRSQNYKYKHIERFTHCS